ncbi:MAG TPA: anaerobic glycerol-3-phosphate dehydrogenase subunit GlpA [Symbiobacteriaceae bacterium]|nr:anaerobic glycerol-3-phosphate dehydrogenase subunit GlpA [Symbiobacteriaceae bacterium]
MQRVVVIGGGATGSGILRDLAMRGIPAVLVEQGDLVHGTSSRYHGLLHSGGRYAVRDPESARECAAENAILRRIAPFAVEPCGGVFLQLRQDDPAYRAEWLAACRRAGVPVELLDLERLRREEPGISPDAVAAYRVPDASVDGFRLISGNVAAAEALGARTLTYRRVTGLLMDGARVAGVRLQSERTDASEALEADLVINAAGAWTGQIAAMAGIHLDLVADRGVLLVYHGRLTSRVINRLRPPGNGDIFVPAGSVTLLGTTATPVESPDNLEIPADEVASLLRLGAEMLPAAATSRVLRAFAGVRPLFKAKGDGASTRDLPRTYQVIDHAGAHGVEGLVSIIGGKLTTYREMAEKTVDMAAGKLGVTAPCRTAAEPILPPPEPALVRSVQAFVGPAHAAALAERHPAHLTAVVRELSAPKGSEILCECEQVTRGEVIAVARSLGEPSLSDIRRRTRLGMGTCQGAFCGYRTALVLAEAGVADPAAAPGLMLEMQAERWHGVTAALPGPELPGAELTYALYAGLFGGSKR